MFNTGKQRTSGGLTCNIGVHLSELHKIKPAFY